jgi:hypothetical protein
MFKRFVFLTILSICQLSVVFAQISDSIVIKRERVFTGKALYGFMNGGSDLFLEYGFKELRALDVFYKGEDYNIEIYKMPTPEDAFGIYSQHTFKCINADSLNLYECPSRFQLQAAIGDEYISIVFGKDSKMIKQGARELLNHFSAKEAVKKVQIPYQFGKIEEPVSGKLKFMRGELAVSNVNSDLNKIVQNISKYNIWYLKSANPERNKVLVFLSDSSETAIVKVRLPINSILSEGKNFILFEF